MKVSNKQLNLPLYTS